MTQRELDQGKSEAFAAQMVGVLNQAAIALMTSIGHQVGLFDAMASLPAATAEEIAAAAGLNERYVREWLGTMVTGRVVDHHPGDQRYSLPPEHAAWLTRAAGTNNLAMQAQYVPLLAQVEERIVHCFRRGGGVPYSAFPRFQRLMAEESGAIHDASLLDKILPLVPGLVARLWAGIDAAEIGCGSGHAVNLLARAFPASRFLGYDLSEEGIAAGRAEADRLKLANARFEVRDVGELDANERYDLVTAFDAVHDQAQPAEVLRRVSAALKPDGVFLMVDIAASSSLAENLDHMLGPFLYAVSCLHCMTVSLARGGAGLGAMWGHQRARRMLADAGFAVVDVARVEGDLLNNYYVARKAGG